MNRPVKRPPPNRVALDISCLVALVCNWHEHHEATTWVVEQRLDQGAELAIAAPALVETYAVLTRMPAPHRLAPVDALQLLRDNFQNTVHTVALRAEDYWSLLRGAPEVQIHGGHTYDAVIAACARAALAQELLTHNVRHFESFGDNTLRIVSPLDAS